MRSLQLLLIDTYLLSFNLLFLPPPLVSCHLCAYQDRALCVSMPPNLYRKTLVNNVTRLSALRAYVLRCWSS